MEPIAEIIALTAELIRIPSMHSHPTEILHCAEFIMKWCKSHQIQTEFILQNDTPSVMIMPTQRTTPLLLMTHFDVVDAPSEMFEPRVEDDRLFGRGAIDDKYAVALSLVLFKNRLQELRAKGLEQAHMPLGLLITGDEETGGENGAGHCLGLLRAQYALALDGGAPRRIITREKGILDIKLTATGKSAHGARPWLGDNAIDILFEDYARIRELFPDMGGDHWHRTANFGKIRAGQSTNQVPQTAQGWFNIRFTEADDPNALLEEVRNNVRSTVECLGIVPFFAPQTSSFTDRLCSLVPGAETTREHGASDARYLMDHDIPGAVWGAQGFGTQHSLEECVSISSIAQLYAHVDAFCAEFSGATL